MKEGVLHNNQSCRTKATPSDGLVSHPGHLLRGGGPLSLCRDVVCIFYNPNWLGWEKETETETEKAEEIKKKMKIVREEIKTERERERERERDSKQAGNVIEERNESEFLSKLGKKNNQNINDNIDNNNNNNNV